MSCFSQWSWLAFQKRKWQNTKCLPVRNGPQAFPTRASESCTLPSPLQPPQALASPAPAAGHPGLEVPVLPGTHRQAATKAASLMICSA